MNIFCDISSRLPRPFDRPSGTDLPLLYTHAARFLCNGRTNFVSSISGKEKRLTQVMHWPEKNKTSPGNEFKISAETLSSKSE